MSVLEVDRARASSFGGVQRARQRLPPRRRVGDRRHHRPQRRGQDDAVQLHHRLLRADLRHGCATAAPGHHRPARAPCGPRSASAARSRTSGSSRARPRSRTSSPRSTSRSATTRSPGCSARRSRSPRRASSGGGPAMLLELLGLDDLAEERAADLPYGVLKRLEIATVLATDPDLMLLDEPGSGMGPEEAHALGDTLLEIRARVRGHDRDDRPPRAARDPGVRLRVLPELRRGAGRGPARRRAQPPRGGAGVPGRGSRRADRRRPRSKPRWPKPESPSDGALGDRGPRRSATGRTRCCTASASRWSRARRASCSASTAPARRPPSRPSPGCSRRPAGTVRFDGEDIGGKPPSSLVPKGIALSPEGRRVFPRLTVRPEPAAGRLGAPPRQHGHARAARARVRLLPAPRRARGPIGGHALRRRAADARHRPGAHVAARRCCSSTRRRWGCRPPSPASSSR